MTAWCQDTRQRCARRLTSFLTVSLVTDHAVDLASVAYLTRSVAYARRQREGLSALLL